MCIRDSYYASAMPRYNTITIAQKYASLCDADMIISDEIPSVAAVKKTETGEWTGIYLSLIHIYFYRRC